MTDTSFFQTGYDCAACKIGIVHIGYGAFHRAHQAVYLDDYMQATGDLRWGIAAVNLRPSESQAFAAATDTENGYLLKSIAPDGTIEFRTVRSHRAFVDAAQDMQAAVELFARPGVHAVSMTVTESGYSFDEDWYLDLSAAPIAAELAGGPVQTIYGFLAAALAHRMATSGAPITVLCCDNIRNNGKVLRAALLSYLNAAGKADLAAWVEANTTFPCSMVDRITPRATPELEAEAARLFPKVSATPVHAEDFLQWVVQDDFAANMPDLAQVGVQVVDDVEPFEEAKIRILNGGHSSLAYLGALGGHVTFDQAMKDPALRPYFDRFEQQNVLPGLEGVVTFDTTAYLSQIARRFENPGIADQLERICMDGFNKMGIFIRPTMEACLTKGIDPTASYDCVASWVVYARKHQAGVMPIPYVDPAWDRLQPLIAPGQEAALASEMQLWGDLPARFDSFAPGLVRAIESMAKNWQT